MWSDAVNRPQKMTCLASRVSFVRIVMLKKMISEETKKDSTALSIGNEV